MDDHGIIGTLFVKTIGARKAGSFPVTVSGLVQPSSWLEMSLRSKLNALIVLNVCNVTAESGLTRQNTACNEAMWATGMNWALGLDTDSWNTSWQLAGGEWTMYSPYHGRPLPFHRFQTSSPSISPRSSPHSRVNMQHRACLPLASASLVVSHAGYSTPVVTVTRITSVGKRNICRLPVGAFRQCIATF